MSLHALVVTLPYPPSANRMWRHVGKKVLRSAEYERWRSVCAQIIGLETRGQGLAGAYAMTLSIGRPDRRRRDIDNLIKPVGDVLVLAGAVADDCDCQRVEAAWAPDVSGVRVRLLETNRIPPSTTAARSGCAGDGSDASASSPELAA
ncbi:crossover junction endodeoxyribonuclease RusA [Methylobacterium sp. BE186]|uniref:RusA family crossover junction endodeoxyribonuclease n=1 Tax=Methylobacterium sp. BE186 TaxID=2817715 RepID=UPI00285F3C53|nr:RusA family crossover junction endodeoxyribonuclease [Methylobacterium sp. BE186]MDR7037425.1 crossover junction endodeoxyribonuclease RusA [Methylobacterium sp. BE186]